MTQASILDLSDAKNRVDGDKQLYFELVETFFGDYADHISLIESGLAGGDAHAVERAAHTVKGALANLSAKRAQGLAFALEQAGRSGSLGGVAEVLAQLKSAVSDFKQQAEAARKSDAWELA